MKEQSQAQPRVSRRRLLGLGLGGSAAAVSGLFLAPERVQDTRILVGRSDFDRAADAIYERHWQQDEDAALALRARYASPVFGPMPVWRLIERLAFCVDPSDTTLYCTNQFLHVQ